MIFLLLAVSVFRHQAAETLTDSRLTYPSESVSPRIIFSPEITPDELYGDSIVVVSHEQETTNTTPAAFMLDHTHDFHWEQFIVPAGVIAASSLFVRTPKLVRAREWVQKQLANRTGQPRTEVDNYLQFLPLAAGYGLYACGVKGEHNLLDKTIILAMSYATFAAVNHSLKFAFGEQRPNSMAMNSFPSGHTGTAFAGAEFLRREYWDTNKWIGVAGYACAAVVGYMRIYNNRHWFNDVLGGAALGYMWTGSALSENIPAPGSTPMPGTSPAARLRGCFIIFGLPSARVRGLSVAFRFFGRSELYGPFLRLRRRCVAKFAWRKFGSVGTK